MLFTIFSLSLSQYIQTFSLISCSSRLIGCHPHFFLRIFHVVFPLFCIFSPLLSLMSYVVLFPFIHSFHHKSPIYFLFPTSSSPPKFSHAQVLLCNYIVPGCGVRRSYTCTSIQFRTCFYYRSTFQPVYAAWSRHCVYILSALLGSTSRHTVCFRTSRLPLCRSLFPSEFSSSIS